MYFACSYYVSLINKLTKILLKTKTYNRTTKKVFGKISAVL